MISSEANEALKQFQKNFNNYDLKRKSLNI